MGHSHVKRRAVVEVAAPEKIDSARGAGEPDQIVRLFRILTYLQREGSASVEDLRGQLNISRRTLFRDLKRLKQAGVPFANVPGRGYCLDPDFALASMKLLTAEVLGLLLLGKVAESLPHQPLLRPAHDAILKILAQLPPAARSVYQDLTRHISFSPGAVHAAEDERMFRTLQRCIDERCVCSATYHPVEPHEPTTGLIHPAHLHFHNRSWYVFAYSEAHESVRMFKLSRFKRLEPIDRTFAPFTFSLESFLDGAWGIIPEGRMYHVRLRFSPRVSRNVCEVTWHASQRITSASDGSAELTFDVNGLNEIKHWILGYGGEVKVLEPAELTRLVEQEARAVVMLYA